MTREQRVGSVGFPPATTIVQKRERPYGLAPSRASVSRTTFPVRAGPRAPDYASLKHSRTRSPWPPTDTHAPCGCLTGRRATPNMHPFLSHTYADSSVRSLQWRQLFALTFAHMIADVYSAFAPVLIPSATGLYLARGVDRGSPPLLCLRRTLSKSGGHLRRHGLDPG